MKVMENMTEATTFAFNKGTPQTYKKNGTWLVTSERKKERKLTGFDQLFSCHE
jgi:hypothetical protein